MVTRRPTTAVIMGIDSFTDRPFRGNPAGVCLLDRPRSDQWMQELAREMNLSETAFLLADGEALHLRWFTPTSEVDLCGHATLAAAHLLFERGRTGAGEILRFHTRSGVLCAESHGPWIHLDFPATPPEPVEPPDGLAEALGGVRFEYVGRSRFDVLVELGSEEMVRGLAPNFTALSKMPARGFIVTSRAAEGDRRIAAGPSETGEGEKGEGKKGEGETGEGERGEGERYDFVSRFFAPAVGVFEDPVTGSAHCCLGPYWARKLGVREVVGYQASLRGGTVRVIDRGDRVTLVGRAVTVMRCELLVGF